MGIVIWYAIQVPGAGLGGLLPLRVSNDVLSGDYILDAEIQLDLVAGAAASSFTVSMANLPADIADSLKAAHDRGYAAGSPLQVEISLGYFDDPATRSRPVLTGVITGIRTGVNPAGLLETELRGYERAGYRLLTTPVAADRAGSGSLDELVARIADAADVPVPADAGLGDVQDVTLRAVTAMQALAAIADATDAPLVVDGGVRMGQAVGGPAALGAGGVGPASFSAGRNIVSLDRVQEEPLDRTAAEAGAGAAGSVVGAAAAAAASGTGVAGPGGAVRTSIELTVLGNPALRVGQPVTVETGAVPGPLAGGELRTERVRHAFSTRRGYTCDVTVVAAAPGARARRASGAARVVDSIRSLADSMREGHPAVDVGEISGYEPGAAGAHSATARYGQSPAPDAAAPSVGAPVNAEPTLHNKPVASPFAFHRCGLMVPVLPGMRALLAHNRGLVNDAVVAGFLWSTEPQLQPPENEPGDWWLCLPTQLGPDGLPAGKGTNDLTDAAGMRVIQAKGLSIGVGAEKLPEVGTRPTVPSAEQLVIEHAAGTTITIASDGSITISTDGKPITLGTGQASITLDGGTVKITGTSVEVG